MGRFKAKLQLLRKNGVKTRWLINNNGSVCVCVCKIMSGCHGYTRRSDCFCSCLNKQCHQSIAPYPCTKKGENFCKI